MARLLVRDPAILSGRWRLEGTTITIAMIREDGNRMGRDLTLRAFAFMDLTGEEYDAAMDFEFPELRTLVLDPVYSSVQVGCVCGEEMPAKIQDATAVVRCICGRTWDVRVAVNAEKRQP